LKTKNRSVRQFVYMCVWMSVSWSPVFFARRSWKWPITVLGSHLLAGCPSKYVLSMYVSVWEYEYEYELRRGSNVKLKPNRKATDPINNPGRQLSCLLHLHFRSLKKRRLNPKRAKYVDINTYTYGQRIQSSVPGSRSFQLELLFPHTLVYICTSVCMLWLWLHWRGVNFVRSLQLHFHFQAAQPADRSKIQFW